MKPFTFACFLLLNLAATLKAGEMQSRELPAAERLGFSEGTHEFEALVGYFKSIDTVIPGPVGRPPLETGLATFRYGWMLNNQRSGFLFGNEEFLLEAFVGPVVTGPGSVLGGGTALLRHNFALGEHSIVIPYLQIGAGLVASDASSDHSQFSIGLPVEFNLQSSLGARWRLNRTWSINTEFNYRHISNAGLSSRNGGYDLVGGFIGLSRMF
jgi:hypothetical protein